MINKEENVCVYCNNYPLTLLFIRIGIAFLFFILGIMKIMNPEMTQGMLTQLLNMEGNTVIFLYWILIIVEVGGAIVVMLGNLISHVLYKIALSGFIIVLLVAIMTAIFPAIIENTYPMAKRDLMLHISSLLTVMGLMFTQPFCPFGITGGKK